MLSKSENRRSVLAAGAAGLAGLAFLVLGGAGDAAAASADVVHYPVAPDVRLNVRSGPGTNYPIVKVLPYDTMVPIFCQTPGTTVSGYYGTSDIWDRIGPNQFVSDTYVHTGSDGYVAARCG